MDIGQLFTTHSLTYFNHYQIWWLHKGNHYINKFDSVIYVRHKYYLESCIVRNNIDLLFIELWDIIVDLSHHYHTLIFIPNKYPNNATDTLYNIHININRNYAIMSAYLRSIRTGLPPGGNWKRVLTRLV